MRLNSHSPDTKVGWKTVKFGEVVKNANLTEHEPEAAGIDRIVGLDHLDPENLHVRRWNTLDDGTSFSRKFVPGQTLFGKRRAYQRKVAFAEFEGICSGDILTFEPKDPDVLLPELLPFICQTDAFFDHALGTSAGSLSPRTSWKALQDFELPLPPIEEQKRIAEVLWAADEAMEACKTALEDCIRLSEVLKSQALKDTRHLTPLGNCVEFLGGLAFKSSDFVASGVQLLRMGNLYERTLDLARQPVFLPDSIAELNKKYLLAPGDIVMSLTGTVGKQDYGFALEIPSDAPTLLLNQRVAKLTPTPAINRQYLLHVLSSRSFLKQVYRMAAGTKQANLLKGQLLAIEIPLPSIDEQEKIAQSISLVRHKMSALGEHIERQRLLGKALQQRLTLSTSAHV